MSSITILDEQQTAVATTDLTSFVIAKSSLLQELKTVKLNTKFTKVAVKEHGDYVLKDATLEKNRLQIRFDLTAETVEDIATGLLEYNVDELLARITEYVLLNAKASTDFIGGVYGSGFDGLLTPSTSTAVSPTTVPTLDSFTYSKLFTVAGELPEKVRSGKLLAVTSPIYAANLVMTSANDIVTQPLKVIKSFDMPKPEYDHIPRAVVFNKDAILVGISATIDNSKFLVESQKTVYCVRLDLDLVSAVSGVTALLLTNGGTNPDPVVPGPLSLSGDEGQPLTVTLSELLAGVTTDSGESLSISNLQVLSGNATIEDS